MKSCLVVMGLLIASTISATTPPQYPTATPIGFIQFQLINDESTPKTSEFDSKRTRLGVTGRVADDISYNLVLGATEPPDNNPHLVNAFIDLHHLSSVTVRVGQFFVPFGLEGPTPIFANPAIERSQAIRRLNPFTMFRDRGIQVSGRHQSVGYAVAVMNGTGANASDNDRHKDLFSRITYRPLQSLTLGGSAHLGTFLSGVTSMDRHRYGTDIEYRIHNQQWRAEFITRRDERNSASTLESQGWYILNSIDLFPKLQSLVRYEVYDPNTSANDDTLTITTIGLNYIMDGHNRMSVNYEFRDDQTDSAVGDRLTAQIQVVF